VSSEAIAAAHGPTRYTSREQVKSDTWGLDYSYGSTRPAIRPPVGANTQAFDAAGQRAGRGGSHSVYCATPPTGATGYTFNPSGDRTATTPAITYDYDRPAGSLVHRPDRVATYGYNGDGLRMTKTSVSTATFVWTHRVHTQHSQRRTNTYLTDRRPAIEQTGPAARSGSCTTRWLDAGLARPPPARSPARTHTAPFGLTSAHVQYPPYM